MPLEAAPKLRQVMKTLYNRGIHGLCGKEGVGEMSGLLILSSMGLYQVEPAGGKYIFGSPLFKKVVVNVGGGKTFTIEAKNNSAKNIYIQRAKLNGKTYTRSYIDYKDIMKGGTLEFVMGEKPSSFGTKAADRP